MSFCCCCYSGYLQLIQKTSLLKRCFKFRVGPANSLSGPGVSIPGIAGSSTSNPMPSCSKTNKIHTPSAIPGLPGGHFRPGHLNLEVPKKVTVRGSFIQVEG
ncbi:hypothetical protein ElyMa_006244900 [Elysia marginata]|uniref:Uncharacterized protein n=1 Tax=Elysia marginata TaxID=1093978 RepID=A0AAV4H8X5_9GAST|nr:hypothetical protein ElyMa_006244900 [Elysia marginata]